MFDRSSTNSNRLTKTKKKVVQRIFVCFIACTFEYVQNLEEKQIFIFKKYILYDFVHVYDPTDASFSCSCGIILRII